MMLLMLLGVIPARALEIYRDGSHTRAYASIRGRWNAGVAIKSAALRRRVRPVKVYIIYIHMKCV